MGISLLAAEMNSVTDFSMELEENLIDISCFAVTACDSCVGSRFIGQPCDVRVIVVSIVPDNTLLRRLRVLHPKFFWIFCPIDKDSVLVR